METWMVDITKYLTKGTLPIDRGKAKKLRTQAIRYDMIAGELYQQNFSSPSLKCLNKE